MNFSDFLTPEAVSADLESSGKLDVLAELGAMLARVCPSADKEQITAALVERERLATTGIGEGVAIPHAKIDSLDKVVGAAGISRTGIQFDSIDGQPVHVFVALLAPTGSTTDHLKALARISKLARNPEFRKQLLGTRSNEEAFEAIITEDGRC